MHTLRLLWAAHNEDVWLRRQQRTISRSTWNRIRGMPDTLFKEHFRFDKRTFRALCVDLRHLTTLRGTKDISLEIKVLCALSFLATGSYQRIVGITCNLRQQTTSRVIREVVEALNSPDIMGKFIKFPQTQHERAINRQEFQRRFNLPGVVGAIDCTHVAIVKPNDDEHIFFNRKGYHSINAQMICNQDLKIINVNAKFGGATHDSYIWSSSQMEPYMRGLHRSGEQTWLLGDSGYPQRPWLMTPILNAAPGSREEMYTNRHVQARNCIERCFGVLKARWRCLLKHRTLHYHPQVASKIINACCVLHNIALNANLQLPTTEQPEDDDDSSVVQASPSTANSQDDLLRGRAMRNCLINRMR